MFIAKVIFVFLSLKLCVIDIKNKKESIPHVSDKGNS